MIGKIEKASGGHWTLFGGTRMVVKTDRPWQVPLKYPNNREECPLCSKPQEDEHFPANGWKTFQNSNTPFPYHRLLAPTECWPDEKLRSLGDQETLRLVAALAFNEVRRTRPEIYPIWIFTHIGYGAGQNFPHHHWHLCGAPTTPKPQEMGEIVNLWETENFTVFLGGVRAGWTFVLGRTDASHRTEEVFNSEPLRTELAMNCSEIVQLYNERFNRPDFCFFFGLHGPEDWIAYYLPILNNWGSDEFAALLFGTPFVLPWPHSATAEWLNKKRKIPPIPTDLGG